MDSGITSILHRDTLATIVGTRTFDRGQRCFAEGRVLGVGSQPGELAGLVRPAEAGRQPYEIRIWVREDGLAYACTCPVGLEQKFCKHAVAIAIAHLEQERKKHEEKIAGLKEQLMNLSLNALLDGLIAHAKADPAVATALEAIADQR